MNYQLLFKELETRRIRIALTGANGGFGRSLLAQCRAIQSIEIAALCDLNLPGLQETLASLGFSNEISLACESEAETRSAGHAGKIALVRDQNLLASLDFDIFVEATGQPELGFQMASRALTRGVHVAMISKETDSVAGPWLSRLAAEHRVTYTAADGDQPSNLIGLISWARLLGFRIVAAGKSSEFDFVFDPATGNVSCRELTCQAPELGSLWSLGADPAAALRRRSELLRDLPQRSTPDYCEMNIVSNSTGLDPSCETLSFPICRTSELADIFIPKQDGGILERTGVVDVFNCLRREEEASFAGGVFVVVECTDPETWRLLREKGHLVSRNLKYACIYLPYHLMGLETPVSLFSAVLHNRPSGPADPKVHAVMIARTERDFRAGETLAMGGHHHEIEGASARLIPASQSSGEAPYYLAANKRLRCNVKAGTRIPLDALDLQNSALAAALRPCAASVP